ncbi:reverse transcriptase domain, reverse transcriptase zinc-binding domain protein [Tanacetum coccineum]
MVVGKVVGDVQNAFIKGRYILDGVLIANEVVGHMRKMRNKGLIFKVDFEKACLRSSPMSILVNGSPTNKFCMERGVRQGDPLLPFLFILAAEGLNAIIKEAVDKGVFRGVKIGINNVVVSHLQYADDTIFLREWKKENAKALMCILKCFEEVSGLRVNYNKSKLYGVGVNEGEMRDMARWMRCGVREFPFTYLGLPIGENMRRVGAWNNVVEKFKNRLRVSSSFVGEVGNGNDIRFWVDTWVGGVRLCDRFPRLYHLDRSKEGRVAEKGKWVDNVWCWDLGWVRNLRGRVCNDFEDLQALLQNVVIKFDCKDRWRWAFQENGVFTVKDLTKLVEEKTLSVASGADATIWNKWVPKKVNIFVWRALQGRLPVREELDKRGIDLDSLLCPSCGDMVESCSHCLVMCNFAMSVWEKIYSWWKIGGVNAFSIEEFFSSNGNANIPSHSSRMWQAIFNLKVSSGS